MSFARRVGVAVAALALAGLPTVVAPGAASAVAGVPCLDTSGLDGSGNQRATPLWRRGADTSPVTAADLAALPAQETNRRTLAREVTPQLASSVTIPVYVHVIKGKHRREKHTAGPRKVRRVISILNGGFSTNQSALGVETRYNFKLRKIDWTRNDSWYHAFLNGPRDRKMKRKLHRGGARSLNLYLNGGGRTDEPVLGWARFPWQYDRAPKLDGVSVNVAALPGGRARGYNLGDTVIHETGHWMGLLHTFQGGCSETNDQVVDTPAEAEPSFYCETTRDTCAESPGLDPVHNFMDYSLDSCMNRFTAGQVGRMDAAFVKWRK